MLDRATADAYFKENPDALAGGWENILLGDPSRSSEGTSIRTTAGDPVLAVDAKNGVVIARVSGSDWRGAIAIASDPARLSLEMADPPDGSGQYIGEIAAAHGGVLAISASGFVAENNSGRGNELVGYAMSHGTAYGAHLQTGGYSRLELNAGHAFSITDASSPVSSDCTDAAEFQPAMIVDGKAVPNPLWKGPKPRACIGQRADGSVVMLAVEGYLPLESRMGVSIDACTELLAHYGCVQAMNLSGGSAASLWYDGQYLTASSLSFRPEGRPAPDAFVYGAAD